ncbi:hypothetical protein QBC32DRAFT_399567 [Pseudoneurospora amorphoporcata]|uniref:Uncharacterized protein n=1 Tax=Pseudoneurospora amorphoporcata TaxID=241081 RepID=A0AAN6NQT6_9PEZI|nr:hypothetical protein QBC32DRAFT_399567 [Pseudoneurospora amorphoporcata]
MVHIIQATLTLLALLLTLSTAAPLIPASAPKSVFSGRSSSNLTSRSWSGTGQIRTLWDGSSHDDLGCLTASGRWTTDENSCGTFTAVRKDGATIGATQFTLTSKEAGPCEMLGTTLVCEKGRGGYSFGIWPFPNGVPGVECLRYGLYGLMASVQGGPPDVNAKPLDLRFTSYVEKGKKVHWANSWRKAKSVSVADSMMGDNIGPSWVGPNVTTMIPTHEFIKMRDREARIKWHRLLEASAMDSLSALKIPVVLVVLAATSGGGPEVLNRAMDRIKHPGLFDGLDLEKALKFVKDTIVPSNMPSDNHHFSLLSLPFSYSQTLLRLYVIGFPNLTLYKLMASPCMIQLDLDYEMRAYAKSRFNDYVYKYRLPNFPDAGDNELFRDGPYSRIDIQEWLDSKAYLRLDKSGAGMDSDNHATLQDGLLDVFGSLSLGTDGDNSDSGDNGGPMDTS